MAIEDLRSRDWILLPGTLCTGMVFDAFLNVLDVPSGRRRTVPLRHGTVEAYGDVLTPLSKGAIVCGFSLGAIVAAHHADCLAAARIILFGLNPHADDPAKAEGRHELARDVAAMGGATAMTSRLPGLHAPDPAQARAAILAMADETAFDIEAQTHLALGRPGAMGALSRSLSPVLVLTGSEDLAAPPAQGKAAADIAPHGQFRLLAQLGHFALLEDAGICAEAVLDMEDTIR